MNTKKEPSKIRTTIIRAARIALIAAPLVWIYSNMDAGAFADTLMSIAPLHILAVAALYLVIVTAQGVKWWVLIRKSVPELKLSRAVSVHWESCFYAIALPTGAAQDVVKSVILSKSHSPSVVWAASWLGRLIGLFAMLLFSVFGTIYLKNGLLPNGFKTALVTSAVVIAVLCAASFSKKLTRPLRGAAALVIPQKFMAKIEKLRDGIYAFKHEKAALAQTFAISASIQFMIYFYNAMIIYAITGEFYLLECLAFVPLVEILVISVPLTPGGMGIREGLMALLFTRLGFTGEQIASYVTISLLMSMVRIVGGIPILWRMRRG